jgi:type I restriction enzyme S subunit
VKANWKSKPIGDVFKVVNGGTPKTGVASNWDGPHAWITPAEMGNLETPFISESRRTLTDEGLRIGAELVPEGSIILSSRAPIGHLIINEIPMAFNQGCKGLIPSPAIDTKFAYYFLLTNVPLLESLGTGATFKELSGGKLKEVLFQFPELGEQRRIVTLLDDAFADIATAKANAEKNLQHARELFNSHLNAIVVHAQENGEIVALSEMATDITDGDHMPPPKVEHGLPFITIGNIDKQTRTIDFADTFKVPREYFDALKANKKPMRGDVLYTVTGSFGIPVLVEDDAEFCFQRHIGLIRPKAAVDSTWLHYLMQSPQVFNQAADGATGTAQKTVSLKVLRNLQVPRISPKDQLAHVETLRSVEAECRRLESIYRKKLTALDDLKKSLLHQAFSGQL